MKERHPRRFHGRNANDIFKTISLSCKNSKSLESSAWADLSDKPNEDDAETYETHEISLQDSDNAVSLAMSGQKSCKEMRNDFSRRLVTKVIEK